MKLLILGSGKGSWEIRGQQLGAALGARVTSAPNPEDYDWADVVILIKRALLHFGLAASQAGKPMVWDALDFWAQPAQNRIDEASAARLLCAHVPSVRPTLIVAATRAMARACQGVYLPHHSWKGLVPTPPRDEVKVVAYQGNQVYMGAWLAHCQQACRARGWTFVVNPPSLADVDLFVAFRDGIWDGWICTEWKSGVKLVNAIAAGRPIIGQSTAAMSELPGPSTVVHTVQQLESAFDEWTPFAARQSAFERCQQLAPEFTVAAIAARYHQVLERQVLACAM